MTIVYISIINEYWKFNKELNDNLLRMVPWLDK